MDSNEHGQNFKSFSFRKSKNTGDGGQWEVGIQIQ